MSRDASFITERNRKRMLFAAKVMQETAFANGLQNTIVREGVPNSAYSYNPHYYNVKEGAYFTSPEELALYQANVSPPVTRTVPGAPTGLTASGVGGTVVVVTFTPPASDGGSPITNYEYISDLSGSFTAFSPPVTSGPVTITGLTSGTSYSIVLRAVNAIGVGTESDPLSVTTTSSPGAPTLTLTLADDSAAYIYFTAGSGSVTNYEYSTDNGSTFAALSPADTNSPIKIPSLANGTTYTVKLRASYYGDVSTASNSLTVTPLAASAPTAYLAYDISNTSSYPGSGTALYNVGSYSATAVTGTLNGAITYSSSNSGILDFNGNNGVYITFPSFNFGNAISATAWVYPRFKANINGLLTNAGANVATNGFKFQWNWWLSSSRVVGMQSGNGTSGGDNYSLQNSLTYDTWQHLGYVFDKTNQKVIFFLNGIPLNMESDIATVANINTSATFNIGGYTGGSYTMNARLGYVKIFNSLLNAGQIYTDYVNTKSRFGL